MCVNEQKKVGSVYDVIKLECLATHFFLRNPSHALPDAFRYLVQRYVRNQAGHNVRVMITPVNIHVYISLSSPLPLPDPTFTLPFLP